MTRIILVGYMGAGKTTIGKALSQELGIVFYDLDWYIENRMRKTVAQIFAEKGEEGFRLIEHNMLHEIAEFEDVIISCGGGTPCFFDNMDYLNEQGQVIFWGWTQPGKTVKVTTSWDCTTTMSKADKDGRWLVKVKTPKASYDPLSITFDDGEPVTVSNVVAGEVWVCAGQSNMEMPVKGFWQCPVKDYNQVVIDAVNHRGVRSVKIPSVMRAEPQDDALCEWKTCSPNTIWMVSIISDARIIDFFIFLSS